MFANNDPFVTDLFLFSYARDSMMSLPENKQVVCIEASNSTSRYLADMLNIGNTCIQSNLPINT